MNGIYSAESYEKVDYRCEYLVVGTGAGGGVAAKMLSEAGRDVIMLEEGPHVTTSSFGGTLSDMVSKLYRNEGASPFIGRPTIAFGEGRCVGGGTTINGGVVWRTPTFILEEWARVPGLSGFGVLDLESHFSTVERDLNVVPETLDEGNGDSVALLNGAQSLGWRTVMEPRAVVNCRNTNLCPIGCPTGAKQGVAETYIPSSLKRGARLFSDCRAVRIHHQNGRASRVTAAIQHPNGRRQRITIAFDHLVLSAGAIQTPHLLRNSRLSRKAGRSLEFHMPLKIVALFDQEISARRGTISTVQVQEFEQDGLLIMTSNLAPAFLAIALSSHGDDVINAALESIDRAGIYMALIRTHSKAHIISGSLREPIVWYRFDPRDLTKIKWGLRRTADVLFEAGAQVLYLPFKSCPVRSFEDLDRALETLKPEQLEVLTVHAMASCPMGPDPWRSVVDLDGRLWGTSNVIIADASILPTNTGTSPQGTIMAFSREVIARHLDSRALPLQARP